MTRKLELCVIVYSTDDITKFTPCHNILYYYKSVSYLLFISIHDLVYVLLCSNMIRWNVDWRKNGIFAARGITMVIFDGY